MSKNEKFKTAIGDMYYTMRVRIVRRVLNLKTAFLIPSQDIQLVVTSFTCYIKK